MTFHIHGERMQYLNVVNSVGQSFSIIWIPHSFLTPKSLKTEPEHMKISISECLCLTWKIYNIMSSNTILQIMNEWMRHRMSYKRKQKASSCILLFVWFIHYQFNPPVLSTCLQPASSKAEQCVGQVLDVSHSSAEKWFHPGPACGQVAFTYKAFSTL